MHMSAIRWNIFARELEDVLAAHQSPLSLIDNRTDVHPERVRRLQRSLKIPKHFSTLNPQDLEKVIGAFHLTEDEVLRLRAAIVATSVEALLMDRIDRMEAYRAANHIFEITLDALRQEAQDLAGIRGGTLLTAGAPDGDDAGDDDPEVAGALEWIDRGHVALHLCYAASSDIWRAELARRARAAYTAALARLEAIPSPKRALDTWPMWYEETRKGMAAAISELRDLGELE